jgi:Flp pilus assembly protein TadG
MEDPVPEHAARRPPPRRRRPALRTVTARLGGPERGDSAIELVLSIPILLLLIMTIIQFGLVWHSEEVAQAAASQALSAARIQGGTQAAGQADADQITAQLAGGDLTDSQVDVALNAQQVTVTVTGQATMIIPFLHLTVHAQAAGPVERTPTP